LCEHGKVNSTDVVNVTTFFATTCDLLAFCAMLTKYVGKFGLLDNISRNRATTVCAKAGADKLLVELASDTWSEKRDVVTYITLMKRYVQQRDTAACLQTFCKMREAKVKPSEISVGIILDSCVQQCSDRIQVDLQPVCDLLLKSDLPMNRVNYTTYMKGLIRVGSFDAAADVLQHMRQTPELSPDLVTYSLVDDLLPKLISLGVKPCTGSLSIMLKVYVKSCSWSKACDLLQSAARRFGIAPEQRIYMQVALACHRAGETHWIRQIYKTMKQDFALRSETIDEAIHRSMHAYCKHRGASVQRSCSVAH